MTEYTVTARNLVYPYGTRFKCRPRFPIETGAICLLTIARKLTVAGYYPNVASSDWIVQPDLIIRVTCEADIEIWGLAEPLDPPEPSQAQRPGLHATFSTIIKISGLVAPLLA